MRRTKTLPNGLDILVMRMDMHIKLSDAKKWILNNLVRLTKLPQNGLGVLVMQMDMHIVFHDAKFNYYFSNSYAYEY